jgi:uracil-DNA glycosylase
MRIHQQIGCEKFPCDDVRHECYNVANIELDPNDIRAVLISEASPNDPGNSYYAGSGSLFMQTTLQAFKDAGAQVETIEDILRLGVYLTTAVKCGKTDYGIKTGTIEECSCILEKELALFPNVRTFLLMGDVAIKAINFIAKREGEGRVIPAGSTYKIRGQAYFYKGRRAFPSYLQAGPSFFIEKSKRRMIAEDLATALNIIK